VRADVCGGIRWRARAGVCVLAPRSCFVSIVVCERVLCARDSPPHNAAHVRQLRARPENQFQAGAGARKERQA